MSISFYILCIIILIFFSINFVKKSNPISNISHIYSSGYKKITFGEEKIWIPWTIGDYHSSIINFTGLIYPIISYYSGEVDPINRGMLYSYKKLTWKRCNETGLVNTSYIFESSIQLEDLYCIDMDDLLMGGQYTHSFVYSIEFDIYLCQNGGAYNESDKNCTSIKDLKKLIEINNGWHFGYYYPQVEFQPHDINNPFRINYIYNYYHLSTNSYKIERLFLSEHILDNDLGWITKNSKNITFWGIDKLTSDIYLSRNDDILNRDSNSRLYQLNIFLSPGYTYYTRKYQKITELLSELFPIFNIIFIVLRYICHFFTSVKLHDELANMAFERKEDVFKLKNSIIKYSKKTFFNEQRPEVHFPKSVFPYNKRAKTANPLNSSDNTFFIGSSKMKEIINKKKSNGEIKANLDNNDDVSNQIKEEQNKNQNILDDNENSNSKKIKIFPWYSYMFALHHLIFYKNCVSKEFMKVKNYLFDLYSINSYINLYQQFSVFKEEILNKEDMKILISNNKININSPTFFKRVNSN